MIEKLKDTDAKQRYLAALEKEVGPLGCILGSRLTAFETMPQSPWSFYTSGPKEAPLALAVRGRAGWLAGCAEPQQLAVLLKVMGVDRLTVSQGTTGPDGWQLQKELKSFSCSQNAFWSLCAPPEDFVIDKTPSLWQIAQLVAEQPGFGEEARDNFYADSCALANRELAKVWGGRWQDRLCATAGAYSIWRGRACLAAVYVQPEVRHRQLGRFLTMSLCQSLCSQGLDITLECSPGREEFYQAMGFAESGSTWQLCPPGSC